MKKHILFLTAIVLSFMATNATAQDYIPTQRPIKNGSPVGVFTIYSAFRVQPTDTIVKEVQGGTEIVKGTKRAQQWQYFSNGMASPYFAMVHIDANTLKVFRYERKETYLKSNPWVEIGTITAIAAKQAIQKDGTIETDFPTIRLATL